MNDTSNKKPNDTSTPDYSHIKFWKPHKIEDGIAHVTYSEKKQIIFELNRILRELI